MENKKGIKIIIAIILVLLVIAIGFGIFIFNKKNGFENEWEEAYFNTLYKDSSENTEWYKDEEGNEKEVKIDYYKDADKTKIKFIQLKENETPVMAVSFKQDNKERFCIYYKTDENRYSKSRNPFIDYETGKIRDIDAKTDYSLQYLYNIEEQEYNWYIKSRTESNPVTFLKLDLNNNESKPQIYSFNDEEMKTNQIADDGTPKLSKFEETFIEVDNAEDNSISIDNIHNIDKNELKENIKQVAKNYKDKIMTEEVKKTTETKLAEIKQKQEQIKAAEEQKAQKEAEEKAKAEEEARKNAEEEAKKKEEEAKKGLKVGNYTLQYGTYVGYDIQRDPSGDTKEKITIKINKDGTYSYNGIVGSYVIKSNQIIGTNAMPMTVTGNNKFKVEVGSGINMTYQGN